LSDGRSRRARTQRLKDGAGFPSGDDAHDARDMVKLLEDYIRLCPEQYWWVHKRFKGRPAPYPDIYARARQSR